MSSQPLCDALLAKIEEQIERTVHLIVRIPDDGMEWRPPVPKAWNTSLLLGHLLDCLAGFCAVLAAAHPSPLAHFKEMRSLRVNHSCAAGEAVERITAYRARIQEGFALLTDADLSRPVETVFVSGGEPLLTLLLGNLEHLVNHKYQLFTYLKLMGVTVASGDLYRFRA
ncbi:MAG TPA: DinB family protein [Candidatus Limnocylindrales bacterium]|nr:DinB family protein [Candidatus Limnocylindrales bacterium]